MWLIDPLDRTVTIYRPGREPEVLTNPDQVAGEGPGHITELDGEKCGLIRSG